MSNTVAIKLTGEGFESTLKGTAGRWHMACMNSSIDLLSFRL
jgi:hypothetical protein